VTDSRQTPPSQGDGSQRHSSTSPTGSRRAGRRETTHRRPPEKTTLQRLRTPVLALVVIGALVAIGAFAFTSASAPAYACTTIDTPRPAAEGQIGQVQPDQGAAHVQAGDKVTYPVCPPASGKHVNRVGFGPLTPQVYGPDDQSLPTGWVHNLEHGGLVLLYACDQGACDDAGIAALQEFDAGFPNSAICNLAPGGVGPVVARFEQMPTRYAALVWNRVLYLDTLDAQLVYDFFLRYAERVEGGRWVAPPEPQCAAPSAGPSAAPTTTP
jgi:hypothetical protein